MDKIKCNEYISKNINNLIENPSLNNMTNEDIKILIKNIIKNGNLISDNENEINEANFKNMNNLEIKEFINNLNLRCTTFEDEEMKNISVSPRLYKGIYDSIKLQELVQKIPFTKQFSEEEKKKKSDSWYDRLQEKTYNFYEKELNKRHENKRLPVSKERWRNYINNIRENIKSGKSLISENTFYERSKRTLKKIPLFVIIIVLVLGVIGSFIYTITPLNNLQNSLFTNNSILNYENTQQIYTENPFQYQYFYYPNHLIR